MKNSIDYGRPVHNVPLALYPGDIPEWRPRNGHFVPTLTPRFPGGKPPAEKTGLVIVVPGGGYGARAEHERTPFADFFNDAGLASALLDYRTVGECEGPLRDGPLADARRAVRLARAHADAWGIHPDKIALLGFSAGGHLTASAGVYFENGRDGGADAAEQASSRPDAMLLAYAVVAGDPDHGHAGSAANLVGARPTAEQVKWFDLVNGVTERTPSTFFFHTADDPGVPVAGVLRFAAGLRRCRVPFEMHIYPHGPHGVGLASDRPGLRDWPSLALSWLRGLGF